MHRIKFVLLGALALLAAGLIAACGGDGGTGGDEDPQTVLDETFAGGKDITSGVFELVLAAVGQAGGEDAKFDLSFGGPFQDQGEGQLPAFDLSFDLKLESAAQDAEFAGAATSTGSTGFLTFMGTTYEVDGEIFDSFKQGFKQSSGAGAEGADADADAQFQALGIDPSGWLTNLQNEGTEDVEGTETIHISGDANLPQIVEDIQSAASTVGDQVPAVPTDQLGLMEDAVTEVKIDVFSGAEDKILRRLAFTFAIDLPEEAGGGGNANFDLSLTLSQLNEEQTIEAPTDAQPLSDLLSQFGLLGLGIGDLGPLGDLDFGPGTVDPAPVAPAPDIPEIPEDIPEIDPGAVPDLPEGGQEFLDCIAVAQSSTDIEDCASLIPS